MAFLIVLTGILILVGVAIAAYFLWRLIERKLFLELIQMQTYLVRIPKEESGAEKDFKKEINKSEQLFSSLAALKKPVVFEVAVPHIGNEISFYLTIPRSFANVAIKQIQGIWHDASVELLADDYNIFNYQGANAAAYVSLKESYVLPIRTYAEVGGDTFLPIIEGFSKINEVGEGAALQVMIEPAPSTAKNKVQNYLKQLRKGQSLSKILGESAFPISLKDIGEALSPASKEKELEEKKILDEASIKLLESKISKPLFDVNIRLVASAGSPYQVDDILGGIAAGFSQFASPGKNEFKIVKSRNPQSLIYQFSFRKFDESKKMILNTEEIASFFHLPTFSLMTPKLKWLKAREAPPPANLPKEGTLIGQSSFRGELKPVYITDTDRLRHFYMVGQTGTGKSNLMRNMAIEDIKRGKGVAVIDPHGDLIEHILTMIPKEREQDLIIFDPGDLWWPVGLNMLEYDFNRPEEKTFIINELFSILDKLFDMKTAGGPMFEQYTRNAIQLLMEDAKNEPATLMELPRVFTDDDFRNRKLARATNPIIIDFWEKEAVRVTGETSLANMAPYITSKFNNFIANDYVRPIIGQPKSAFNFREVMDKGKILLVNLAKGRIGDINANLLGMIFSGKILMAALARVDMPESERRDFYLYIDEFQNFTTESISIILSEARKYRLSLNVAHQFIAQLNEKIKNAVFGNVGSMAVFRVGQQDAEFLAKQFEPVFNQNDLINIDNFNAYVKMLINGEPSKAFNIKTLPPAGGNFELAKEYKEYSRNKYGVDRQIIEEEIYRRLRA